MIRLVEFCHKNIFELEDLQTSWGMYLFNVKSLPQRKAAYMFAMNRGVVEKEGLYSETHLLSSILTILERQIFPPTSKVLEL